MPCQRPGITRPWPRCEICEGEPGPSEAEQGTHANRSGSNEAPSGTGDQAFRASKGMGQGEKQVSAEQKTGRPKLSEERKFEGERSRSHEQEHEWQKEGEQEGQE